MASTYGRLQYGGTRRKKQAFLVPAWQALVNENLVKKVGFLASISASLLVPKPPQAHYCVTINLRPSHSATKKDGRYMPNMDFLLLQTADPFFSVQAGLVNNSYEVELYPDDAHMHTFRGAASH